MKLHFLMLIIIPVFCFGQTKFAPLNATWNYEGHQIDCLGNHKQYKVEKEISVQGKDCSVIYAYSANILNPQLVKSNDSLIVWENDNKVYFLEDTTFYILYNFNLEIGDTLIHYDPINKSLFSTSENENPELGPTEFKTYIRDIKIETIDNQQLKFYKTEIVYPENNLCKEYGDIIENIGSRSEGITGGRCVTIASGCFGGLQCYQNDSIEFITTFPPNTPNPFCDILDSNEDANYFEPIVVYPNPTSNILNFKTDIQFLEIQIFDTKSRLIKSFNFKKNISIDELVNGVYFFKFSNQTHSSVIRVIKN